MFGSLFGNSQSFQKQTAVHALQQLTQQAGAALDFDTHMFMQDYCAKQHGVAALKDYLDKRELLEAQAATFEGSFNSEPPVVSVVAPLVYQRMTISGKCGGGRGYDPVYYWTMTV